MIEIKITDDELVELYLTSSSKRHVENDERLRDIKALYAKEEFLGIFAAMKVIKDIIDPEKPVVKEKVVVEKQPKSQPKKKPKTTKGE